jgi:aspartyl-tRNA(Asn)/glutamyl-tRNA(Gln) amidotransferase subunit B
VSTPDAGRSTENDWELVVGLEVHAELQTVTKIFCGCPNAFGSEPNTNVCPVCLGLPGSLPVLNRQVVELAIRLGAALHCEVRASLFHRKNYFYPDMPKDYQVTQYDLPIDSDGWLDLPDGSRVGIVRAHMEEDTGKSSHLGSGTGRIHGADSSLVDYNRAGVPLLEIVSAPDIVSSQQAKAYVTELRAILAATGVSDAKMEEGSMRVDANVSVRRPGDAFGTRCEVKNVNSIRSVGRAIDYEMSRQIEVLESGGTIRQETRHWDEADGRTHTLRVKEDADDYRYFPEPDLVPVQPDDEWLARVRASMPVLPAQRRTELASLASVSVRSEAVLLAVDRDLDSLAAAAISAGGDPARVLVHIEHDLAVDGAGSLDPTALATLTIMEVSGKLSSTQAKDVLGEMVSSGSHPEVIAAARGYEAMTGDDLAAVVDEAIAANADAWGKVLSGNEKAIGAITGAVMKATKGKADGKRVAELLDERRRV